MLRSGSFGKIALLVLFAVTLAGCEVVGGIFKAGIWVGAIAVVLIIVLLVFVVGKLKR